MTMPTILFELFNLTVTGGTGIATYARNLCSIAAALGYNTEGLLHSNRPISAKDPVLAEIGFFDARSREPSAFTRYVGMNWRRVIGAPFGIDSVNLNSGAVVLPRDSHTFGALSRLHVAPLFMDVARLHFKRWGKSVRLNVNHRPDVFHATHGVPIYVPGAANVYTVHDIVPLRLPYATLDDKKYFLNTIRHLGRVADRIVTVSEASRDDIIRFCGVPAEKIVNTYQAVSFPRAILEQSREDAARLVKQTFDLEADSYYLFYGALEPKKNVGRLIDAYLASGTKRRLVIAGGLGWDYGNDLDKISDNRSNALRLDGRRIVPDERIRRMQHLPLFQLTALIRNARAVLFPSLYEGFGLPVLESMLLGTPVLTSDVSSLSEIAGNAAVLVDPTDISSVLAGIQELDADDAACVDRVARGRLQANKFSSEIYKARIGKVYEDVLAVRSEKRGALR